MRYKNLVLAEAGGKTQENIVKDTQQKIKIRLGEMAPTEQELLHYKQQEDRYLEENTKLDSEAKDEEDPRRKVDRIARQYNIYYFSKLLRDEEEEQLNPQKVVFRCLVFR